MFDCHVLSLDIVIRSTGKPCSICYIGCSIRASLSAGKHSISSKLCTHTCVQEISEVTDNAAVLQRRVTKSTNQFLSTLAAPGEAQFLTVLKPCSILLPHTHQRANEFYSVLFGALPVNCCTSHCAVIFQSRCRLEFRILMKQILSPAMPRPSSLLLKSLIR
jgi:Cupin